MDLDPSLVVSTLGALGIGSFVGQYLIGSQQRRQVRSEVLRHLGNTEIARWAGLNTADHPGLRTSIRELETAALIARVPRRVVDHYKRLAFASWWMSEEHAKVDPDDEFAGAIDSDLAHLTQQAAAEVSRLVWSPWLGRVRLSRRLQELDEQARTLLDQSEDRDVSRIYARAGRFVGAIDQTS